MKILAPTLGSISKLLWRGAKLCLLKNRIFAKIMAVSGLAILLIFGGRVYSMFLVTRTFFTWNFRRTIDLHRRALRRIAVVSFRISVIFLGRFRSSRITFVTL